MKISPSDGGTTLFFSLEELAARSLSPCCLTQDQALPLIRGALAEARLPIPPAMEISLFPSPRGALFFLRPQLRQGEKACIFSVTFS